MSHTKCGMDQIPKQCVLEWIDGLTRGQKLRTTSGLERKEHTMTANKLIREPLWATLLAAWVAAMVSFFVFVQSGETAPQATADNQSPR